MEDWKKECVTPLSVPEQAGRRVKVTLWGTWVHATAPLPSITPLPAWAGCHWTPIWSCGSPQPYNQPASNLMWQLPFNQWHSPKWDSCCWTSSSSCGGSCNPANTPSLTCDYPFQPPAPTWMGRVSVDIQFIMRWKLTTTQGVRWRLTLSRVWAIHMPCVCGSVGRHVGMCGHVWACVKRQPIACMHTTTFKGMCISYISYVSPPAPS